MTTPAEIPVPQPGQPKLLDTHVLKYNGFAVKSPVDRYWSSALRRRNGAGN